MNIVERVKKICLAPNTEWPVIAGETTSAGTLISGYVLPLAGISAIAGFIGGSLVGHTLPFIGTYRVPFVAGLGMAVFGVVMTLVGVFVLSLIINALAPTFGAQKNSDQALKVAVYSFTPAWVGGVFMILPALGMLAALGGLYGLYLMYLGLPRLMKCPDDKAIGYTAVVLICAIVLGAVIGSVTGGVIGGAGLMGAGVFGDLTGANSSTAADVVVDHRLVHEKSSKSGNNEFAMVLGKRFIVSTRGRGVDLNELKAAASSLDLGRLESMREEGVQR